MKHYYNLKKNDRLMHQHRMWKRLRWRSEQQELICHSTKVKKRFFFF